MDQSIRFWAFTGEGEVWTISLFARRQAGSESGIADLNRSMSALA